MNLTEIIKADAAYCAGVDIECNVAFSWVSIGPDIFLQGHEADEFNDEVERLWNESGDTTIDECRAHVAKPYLDALF